MRNYILVWEAFVDKTGGRGFTVARGIFGNQDDAIAFVDNQVQDADVTNFGAPVVIGPTKLYFPMRKQTIVELLNGTLNLPATLVGDSPRGRS